MLVLAPAGQLLRLLDALLAQHRVGPVGGQVMFNAHVGHRAREVLELG